MGVENSIGSIYRVANIVYFYLPLSFGEWLSAVVQWQCRKDEAQSATVQCLGAKQLGIA